MDSDVEKPKPCDLHVRIRRPEGKDGCSDGEEEERVEADFLAAAAVEEWRQNGVVLGDRSVVFGGGRY